MTVPSSSKPLRSKRGPRLVGFDRSKVDPTKMDDATLAAYRQVDPKAAHRERARRRKAKRGDG